MRLELIACHLLAFPLSRGLRQVEIGTFPNNYRQWVSLVDMYQRWKSTYRSAWMITGSRVPLLILRAIIASAMRKKDKMRVIRFRVHAEDGLLVGSLIIPLVFSLLLAMEWNSKMLLDRNLAWNDYEARMVGFRRLPEVESTSYQLLMNLSHPNLIQPTLFEAHVGHCAASSSSIYLPELSLPSECWDDHLRWFISNSSKPLPREVNRTSLDIRRIGRCTTWSLFERSKKRNLPI